MLAAILGKFLCVGSIVLIQHEPGCWEEQLAELLAILSHRWEELPLLLRLQISQIIMLFFIGEYIQALHGCFLCILSIALRFKMLSLGWIVEACVSLFCHLFFFSQFHAINKVLMGDIIFRILQILKCFNRHKIYLCLIISSSVGVQGLLKICIFKQGLKSSIGCCLLILFRRIQGILSPLHSLLNLLLLSFQHSNRWSLLASIEWVQVIVRLACFRWLEYWHLGNIINRWFQTVSLRKQYLFAISRLHVAFLWLYDWSDWFDITFLGSLISLGLAHLAQCIIIQLVQTFVQ